MTTGNFYYQDSLGNTSHVTDAAGNLLERYTYSAFGTPTFFSANNTQLSTSAYGIRHLFQGQLWTQETGLNDYRNRVELPVMGVFLQPDPIGFKGDAANIYRFCGNDPVDRIDPMGLVDTSAVKLYSTLTSWNGGGDWVKGSDGLTASDWNHKHDQPAGNITFAGQWERDDGAKADRKSMHERSIEMLAQETHRGHVSQTGAVTDAPPYQSKIVDEHLVYIDPNNIQRGKKDIGLEQLVVPGPKDQKIHINIIHYHERIGKYGQPTEQHDLAMVKKYGMMYLTDKAWAAQGKYQILRKGEPPEVFFDRRIIP